MQRNKFIRKRIARFSLNETSESTAKTLVKKAVMKLDFSLFFELSTLFQKAAKKKAELH